MQVVKFVIAVVSKIKILETYPLESGYDLNVILIMIGIKMQ